MADTIVEIMEAAGLTLTLKLYPLGSDTIANGAGGDAFTEETNRSGVYQATVSEALAGWYTIHVLSGNVVRRHGFIELADDTSIYRPFPYADLTALEDRLTAARAGYLDNLNGHSPQSGDSYAIVSSGTHGNAALNTDLDSLLARLTAARAGYLENLNIGGNVAGAADIAAITQAQRVRIVLPGQMERPDAGSTAFRVWIYSYNETHAAEDLDSVPAIALLENQSGTDRSGNASAVSKQAGTTGVYYFDYTVADSHAIEGLTIHIDCTEGGITTRYAAAAWVVDTTAVDYTSADRARDDAISAIVALLPDAGALSSLATDADLQTVLARLTADRAGYLDNLNGHSPQSGDSYGIVSSGTHGNAALNTDLDSLLARLTADRAGYLDSLNGHSPQSGDSYAIVSSGTHGNAALRTLVDAVKIITDRMDGMLEVDGVVYRFTVNALEQAPAGGGGGGTDWTTDELQQIRYRLGIDGDTAAPTSNSPHLTVLTEAGIELSQVLTGSTLTITRGDDLSVAISSLGSIADRANLYFTCKRSLNDLDSEAIIQIDTSSGLRVLNGADASGDAASAAIGIVDEDAGDVQITIDADQTAQLAAVNRVFWDLQIIETDGTVRTLAIGRLTVSGDVTRAVS